MGIVISCVSCNYRAEVAERLAGRGIKCLECGGVIMVPDARGQVLVSTDPHLPQQAAPEPLEEPRPKEDLERQSSAALVWGIVSLLLCQVLAPVAILRGLRTLRAYKSAGEGASLKAVAAIAMGGLGLAALACGLVLAYTAGLFSITRDHEHCHERLIDLNRRLERYRSTHGLRFPSQTGRAFWVEVVGDQPDACCIRTRKPFRGPSADVNRTFRERWYRGGGRLYLACDDPGGHPDGGINVFWLDFTSRCYGGARVYPGDPAYAEALVQTKE